MNFPKRLVLQERGDGHTPQHMGSVDEPNADWYMYSRRADSVTQGYGTKCCTSFLESVLQSSGNVFGLWT